MVVVAPLHCVIEKLSRPLIAIANFTAIAFVFSACVSSTLDVPSRGEIAIPSAVHSLMREKSTSSLEPVFIRIFKQESELEVWKRGKSGHFVHLKTYPMCRWSGQLGPKKAEGDRQAPEGIYQVGLAGLNPNSQYFLSFNLGYPNRLEKAKGYTGSALMVHGACTSSGCFAISDEHVAEVYALVRDALRAGQPSVQVQSLPFRMTPQNLAKHRDNPNYSFWMDLKEATTRFEVMRQPPEEQICEGRYRFGSITDGSQTTDPLGQCPELSPIPAAVSAALAADALGAEQILNGSISASTTYADGGMHPSFRKILRMMGPERLANATSVDKVPVSRPAAALNDPHNAD